MSIAKALDELYRERDRLDAERARIDEAIGALEGLGDAPSSIPRTSCSFRAALPWRSTSWRPFQTRFHSKNDQAYCLAAHTSPHVLLTLSFKPFATTVLGATGTGDAEPSSVDASTAAAGTCKPGLLPSCLLFTGGSLVAASASSASSRVLMMSAGWTMPSIFQSRSLLKLAGSTWVADVLTCTT